MYTCWQKKYLSKFNQFNSNLKEEQPIHYKFQEIWTCQIANIQPVKNAHKKNFMEIILYGAWLLTEKIVYII